MRTLTASHNPISLFEDLHLDSLDGECHFTTSMKTLLVMSKVIEDTLKLHKKRCSLYSGFQVSKRSTAGIDVTTVMSRPILGPNLGPIFDKNNLKSQMLVLKCDS